MNTVSNELIKASQTYQLFEPQNFIQKHVMTFFYRVNQNSV